MLTTICQVLQKTLDLNRYAALPFVTTGAHNGTDQWLQGFRERLVVLLEMVDRAKAELGTPIAGPQADWTDAERTLFGEFLARNYPNEATAGMIALGDAWKDGIRVASGAKDADHPTGASQFVAPSSAQS
jgi:hypothetical protein